MAAAWRALKFSPDAAAYRATKSLAKFGFDDEHKHEKYLLIVHTCDLAQSLAGVIKFNIVFAQTLAKLSLVKAKHA